jgi:hypothetical protein
MKTALIFICTGEPYWQYLEPAIAGAKQFFPADILLFTDSPTQYPVAKQVFINQTEWPGPTLMRYHYFLGEREWLEQYEYIFYLDVDMKIVQPIGDEIFADGITVQEHVGYMGRPGTPETDPRSTACCTFPRVYVHGAFQGGTTKAYLELCEVLKRNIDMDNANNFIAKWHDESHLNRYVFDHPPAKILSGVYCSNGPAAHINWINKGTPLRPAQNGKQLIKAVPRVRGTVPLRGPFRRPR